MNIGELKKAIEEVDDFIEIQINGAYGAQGDIEDIYLHLDVRNKNKNVVIFESDICSG